MKTYTINLQVLSLWEAMSHAWQIWWAVNIKQHYTREVMLDTWNPWCPEGKSDNWFALARKDIETCLKFIEEDKEKEKKEA